MNEKSLFLRFLSKVYKVLICIFVPLLFLYATYLLSWLLFRGRIIYHILDMSRDMRREEFLVGLLCFLISVGVGFVGTCISQQFMHIVMPRFASKKSFVWLWIYYCLAVFVLCLAHLYSGTHVAYMFDELAAEL